VPDLRPREGSNPALGCSVPTPTLHAIPPGSVNEYQRVNGYTTRCTGPVSVVLRLRAGVRLRAKETEISAAPWALEARERTLLYLLYLMSKRWKAVPYLCWSIVTSRVWIVCVRCVLSDAVVSVRVVAGRCWDGYGCCC